VELHLRATPRDLRVSAKLKRLSRSHKEDDRKDSLYIDLNDLVLLDTCPFFTTDPTSLFLYRAFK
jgi:hypothetical protein